MINPKVSLIIIYFLLALIIHPGFNAMGAVVNETQPITNNQNATSNYYLPMLYNGKMLGTYDFLVDLVILGEMDWVGYPGYNCIYGYTTGIVATPIYSVTLEIDYTMTYCEDSCYSYSQKDYVNPRLRATLQDQENPFSYCLMYTVQYYSIDEVEVINANLYPIDGRVTYPLTVMSTMKAGSEEDTIVYGTIKNDSGHRLSELSIVGIAGLCRPKTGALGAAILDPGETASYIFDRFYCPGSGESWPPPPMLEISAQGVAEP